MVLDYPCQNNRCLNVADRAEKLKKNFHTKNPQSYTFVNVERPEPYAKLNLKYHVLIRRLFVKYTITHKRFFSNVGWEGIS